MRKNGLFKNVYGKNFVLPSLSLYIVLLGDQNWKDILVPLSFLSKLLSRVISLLRILKLQLISCHNLSHSERPFPPNLSIFHSELLFLLL